jgi:hypothetical protein
MALQMGRFRNKQVAFWCIGADSIDVAVVRNAVGEPLIEACAGVDCLSVGRRPPHAAGIFDLAGLVSARGLGHVAALGPTLSQLASVEGGPQEPVAGRIRVAVPRADGLLCDADEAAATGIAESFRVLGYRLIALDCAACAELSLTAFLGDHTNADQSTPDPLAAVAVSPEFEETAVAMGERLAVPVGLALEHLGWLGDA